MSTESHPYAELFPLAEGQPLWDLADDIKTNGQQEPIWLFEGKILDGRRRELACIRAQVEPWRKDYKGADPLAFVVSKNLHRRHLGEADRARIAAKIATMKVGRPGNADIGPAGPISEKPMSTAKAAEMMNVSEKSVKQAKKIAKKGSKKLKDAEADGTITPTDAARIADAAPEVQDAAIEKVRSGQAKTATKAALKPLQNGRMTFDWTKVEKLIGPVVRLTDEIKNAYKLTDADLAPLREMLGHVARDFGILKQQLTGSKP